MPLDLNTLTQRTTHVTVKFDGTDDTLEVDYRPAVYTPEFENRVNEGVRANDAFVISRMLSALLVKWDLLEDAKSKTVVGLAEERLRTVPLSVLSKVLSAIAEDMRPKTNSGSPSNGGSLE